MKKYFNTVEDVSTGRPVANAEVAVFDNLGNLATIYSDDGITITNNPVKSDATGYFEFWADGVYTLEVSYNGALKRSISGVEIIEAYPYPGLSDGEVTTPKLGDGAVTSLKIATGQLIAPHLTDDPDELAAIADKLDAATLTELASDEGAEKIGWQRADSAKVQTVAEKLGLIEVLATDFENVAPDKSAECAVACQNAINKAIQAGFRRIRFPAFGSGDQGYIIGDTLWSKDTSGDSGADSQIAIVGDGKDSTMFWPDDEFTAIHIVTSSWASGGFGVTFPDDTPSGRASTRIGVAFADDDHQVARCEISDIVVRNAYRSFVLEQHGGSLGTMWLVTLRRLISQGAANWGIRLDSKTGSTTLRLDQVHVDAGTTGGKGAYINNFNDVFGNIAIDKCDNDWLEIVNANVVNLEELALEGCTHDSTTGSVRINSQIAIIQAVKELACIYDPGVGNTAPVVNLGGNVLSARVGGWSSQANTITSGARAKVRLGVATTHCHVIDRSILPSEVVHNGFFANYVFEGRRLSITGTIPNYGAWLRGDRVQNGAPATGQPKGWMCETSGSPGTWTSEGNL